MTNLPSRESILDDSIVTSDWKTYYGDIRDYISLLPFAQVSSQVTIANNSITVSNSANKVLAESNLPVTIDNIKTDGLQDSQVLLLYKGNEEHNISLKNGGVGDGSIVTLENKDVPLSMDFPIILQRDGNNWKQIDLIGSMRATDEDIDEGTSKIKFPTVEQMKPYMGTAISAQLGVVIYSMKPAVGCLECNDTEHQGNTYKTLYAAIVDGTLPSVSYDEYQSQSSSSGFCEKFGLDSDNGKFKCPNLSSVKFGETTYKAYVGAWNTSEKNVMDLQGILDQCLVVQTEINEKGEEIKTYVEQSLQQLTELKESSIQEIEQTKTSALEEITTQETTSLANIEQKRVDSINSVEAKRLEITSVGQGEIDKLNALSTSLTNSFNTNAQEKQSQVDASADEAEEWANKSKEYADKAQTSSFGNIGDIKYTSRTDIPNGGVWCDGAEYTKEAFPDIYQMLVDNKLLNTDYATFNNLVSLGNSCGYFALDTSTQKFKVPYLQDVYIKTSSTTLGFVAESLPNIKGELGLNVSAQTTGAFSFVRQAFGYTVNSNNNDYRTTFDASRSSSTYQDGAKVNPDHVVYRAYVVLYSSAAEVSETQAAEFINTVSEVREEYARLDSQKTNCITKIKQDIKLELNDGTLTLKAGSKIYIPNGVGVFDVYTTQTDISITDNLPQTMVFFINKLGAELHYNLSDTYSGDAQPSIGQYAVWYDTRNNIIKATADSGSSWIDGWSLPICIMTSASTNGFTSIDQVFNGFGYIGSTIFALPNVEGLIPNGRNADGSLNNIKFTTTSVLTVNNTGVQNNSYIGFFGKNAVIIRNYLNAVYDEYDNVWNNPESGNDFQYCMFGTFSANSNGRITSLSPKNVFQAVDRNDGEWASTASKPSSRYVDLDLGSVNSKYVAPANGTFVISAITSDAAGAVGLYLGNYGNGIGYTSYGAVGGQGLEVSISVKKGSEVQVYYSKIKTPVSQFRFYFDEGVA